VAGGFQNKEDESMKCVICKQGETRQGKTTVTLERDGTTLVVKGVPANICANCGEEYLDEDVTAQLLQTAEDAVRARIQVDIREFAGV
jgi:YgiT-type zinc finger domain-containing protein